MRTLLILRHAKSSWSNANLTDRERPLNARGKRDAPRMGKLLRDEGLIPDLIITSSAERARATAELVAFNCQYEGQIAASSDLYHADPSRYIARLREVEEGRMRVMAVGHNPGLEELLELLTGEARRLPTAALAHVELPLVSWRKLSTASRGNLRRLWLPRELSRR